MVPKRSRGIVAVFALSLFVLQLSLSLLMRPLNQILCLEGLNESSAASAHDHHHGDALLDSHTEPSGNTLQHCKDTVFGIAVTPIQPFSLPFATTLQAPGTAWASPSQDFHPVFDRTLAPPFQPPRA
ncbi:MAG: hypothetical protein HY316_08715 [Acidobacteria bacterium]|nr:hypothetical protein [Acidobacteriota bacterium]